MLQPKLMDLKQISKLSVQEPTVMEKTKGLAPELKCKMAQRQKYVIKSFVINLINQVWVSQVPVVFELIL